MTSVRKTVSRITDSVIYERGRNRNVIVSMEPHGLLAFRLKGTKRTYRLPADKLYMMALKAEVQASKPARAKRTVKRGWKF